MAPATRLTPSTIGMPASFENALYKGCAPRARSGSANNRPAHSSSPGNKTPQQPRQYAQYTGRGRRTKASVRERPAWITRISSAAALPNRQGGMVLVMDAAIAASTKQNREASGEALKHRQNNWSADPIQQAGRSAPARPRMAAN